MLDPSYVMCESCQKRIELTLSIMCLGNSFIRFEEKKQFLRSRSIKQKSLNKMVINQ